MRKRFRLLKLMLIALFGLAFLGVAGLGAVYFTLAPNLPSVETLREVRFQVPLRILTRDGELIAEYGEKRRTPVRYDEIPPIVVQAFIAAEDDRFFSHPGVDYQGLARAIWNLVLTGERSQGGSTITMQVARNFFLSNERTYTRKLNEILLALKIERELSKEEILELYLNKIYLGNRAYGVAAAAQAYYGKPLSELTIAQTAMIAGLPKAPSSYNPLANPERALIRRAYVLRRMHELNYIDTATYEAAKAAPLTARNHALDVEVEAQYVAEMVRAEMVERFGAEEAYTEGFTVYTTIDKKLQEAANRALRAGLLEYDERHGYRGPIAKVDLAAVATLEDRQKLLQGHQGAADIRPALVLEVGEEDARILVRGDAEPQVLPWEGMQWAKKFVNREVVGAAPKKPSDVVAPGDVIRVRPTAEGWRLAQIPEVEGALVSVSPYDGAIVALVGGFDYFNSKFNRATQALRQPGSAFKPFVYSAALDKGYTPATVINDSPVVFNDAALEGAWKPENYSRKFYGPTRFRQALVYSRNLVSVRILRDIGVPYAVDYMKRFGFAEDRLAHNLSMSLGNASVTPLEMAEAYAIFANGGRRVRSYVIDRVENTAGDIIYRANPAVACIDCGEHEAERSGAEGEAARPVLAEQAISPQNAYLMASMLNDVARVGTAARLRKLGRSDIGGKTGTTNEQRDAWFSGFNADLSTTAWVGFDQSLPMGNGETGTRTALPVWEYFMREALEGVPERPVQRPSGLVRVRIDPETGLAARAENRNAIFETFTADRVPPLEPAGGTGGLRGPEQSLF